MRPPRIGLNADLIERAGQGDGQLRLGSAYIASVEAAGGVPVVLPVVAPHLIPHQLHGIDGVVLVGGSDYHPDAFGGDSQPAGELMARSRHDYDLALARHLLADRERRPLLGICGGMQLLAIAAGGSLVQDIPSRWPQPLPHARAAADAAEPVHALRIAPGSRLLPLMGPAPVVNSFHHQAVRPDRPGSCWRTTAWSADGVVEACEGLDDRWLVGVQWHPERMADADGQRALFATLITAATTTATA
jgi:gamma-glutamyl-gamma-aminobutyrate hydrolase PuuD